MQQQDLNLSRVKSAIADSIVAFVRARLASGSPQFHADELRQHVAKVHPTAPASADRVLRDLRQNRRVMYTVINRRASLYQAMELRAA